MGKRRGSILYRSGETALATLCAILLLAACAGERQSGDTDDDDDDWDPPVVTQTVTPTPVATVASCSNPSGTLVALSLVNGTVTVGQNVVWQVSGSGCSRFRLERFGHAPFEFSNTTFFATTYLFPTNGMIEVVSIRPILPSGQAGNAITVPSAPFTVVAGSGGGGGGGGTSPNPQPLICSVGGPYNLDVPVDAFGNPIGTPPVVTMPVTTNRPTYLRGMSVDWGWAQAHSGIPNWTSSGIHNPQVRVLGRGSNVIRFEVEDVADFRIRTTCTGTVTLRGVHTPPAQCTLVASRYSVRAGENVTFTLTSSGSATSGTIDGVAVSPNGGQRVLKITAARNVHASVTGPGGTTNCQTHVSVYQDRVGINYEDWTDRDFNDAVVCMTGFFEIEGRRIISHANQTVVATTTRISACDHDVVLRVRDQNHVVRRQISYRSSQSNGASYSLSFEPGWTIDSRFTPLGGCSSTGAVEQLWQDPPHPQFQRIQLGHYCNTTGG